MSWTCPKVLGGALELAAGLNHLMNETCLIHEVFGAFGGDLEASLKRLGRVLELTISLEIISRRQISLIHNCFGAS